MLDYLIFAASFVVVLIISVIYLYPGSKKLTTVPGPEPVDPLEGNYPDISASGSLHEFLVKLHDIYGKVASFWAGPQLCISVASPEFFEQLTGYFDRPEILFQAPELLWGEDSPFVMSGSGGRKTHEQLTRRFNPSFVNASLKLNRKLMTEHITCCLQWPKDTFFPLHEKASFIALKYLVTSLFCGDFEDNLGGGKGTNLIGGGDGDDNSGSGGGDGLGNVFDKKEILDLKNSLDHAWLEVDNCIIDSQDVDGRRQDRLKKYKENIEGFIKKALKKKDTFSQKEGIKSGKIIKSKGKDGGADDDDDDRKEARLLMSIICDGYYKLSSLLTWFGYFIAMEPDVQERLRKEMCGGHVGSLKVEDFNKMSYLQAAIKESLRLGNIVPYTTRVQNFETVFDSHKIPAGTPILQALGVVNNDEEIFEEAESFNPDRFLSKTKPPAFACHHFGFAGNRKCPGANISQAFLAYFYANFLKNFEIKLASDEPICPHFGFYVKPKEEVWLSLKKLSG